MFADKDPIPELHAARLDGERGDRAPWRSCYEPGVPAVLPESDSCFHEIFDSAAAGAPTLPAVSFVGVTLRYATIQTQVERVARALRDLDWAVGDAARVALPDCPELLIVCLGIQRAGGVVDVDGSLPAVRARLVVGTATTLRDEVAARDLAAAERIVLVDPAKGLGLHARLLVSAARVVRRRPRVPRGAVGWGRWLGGLRRGEVPPAADVPPHASALVARGQRFEHRHLVAGAAQLRAWLTDAMAGDETWLMLAPLATPFGLVSALGTATALRARIVLLPSWNAEDVCDALRYLRPSWVVADAGAIASLAADERMARADVRSVRGWITCDPVPRSAARSFVEMVGMDLCEGYAPSTAAGLACCNPVNGRRRQGSVGVPMPGNGLVYRDGRWCLEGPNLAGRPEDMTIPGTVDEDGFVWLKASADPVA